MSETTTSFSPVGVTFETLDRLFKEDHGGDLIALYMGYAVVSHWQEQYRPYATDSYMLKKLKWGDERFLRAKRKLVALGLIVTHMQDKSLALRDEKTGKILKTFIHVNHLVSTTPHLPGSGFHESVVNEEQVHSTSIEVHTTNKVNTTTNVGGIDKRTYGNPEVNRVIQAYEKATGIKTSKADRKHASNAIREYQGTVEELEAIIPFVWSRQHEQYCPQIPNMMKLYYKIKDGGIQSYIRRNSNQTKLIDFNF